MMKYPISEIFPAIQGEGLHMGRRTQFIRFAGCPVKCEWCDTSYAQDISNAKEMTEDEIIDALGLEPAPIITLTGGEPTLHELENLCQKLLLRSYEVHVETSGVIWVDWLIRTSFMSVSPKRHHLRIEVLDKIFHTCQDRSQIKVVIFSEEDIKFAKMIHKRYLNIPMVLQGGYEKLSSNIEYINGCKELAEIFITDSSWGPNVRVLPQLHRLLWPNQKGI